METEEIRELFMQRMIDFTLKRGDFYGKKG